MLLCMVLKLVAKDMTAITVVLQIFIYHYGSMVRMQGHSNAGSFDAWDLILST